MDERLDDLLADLRQAPDEPRLGGVEDRVWRRVAARREARTTTLALAPTRAAMVGAALAAGLAAGGVSAAAAASQPPEMSALSVDCPYLPSTLLERGE